mmetsp:Transcript_8644/g.18976  ORF Transcript_8644/g.18976 Transcript_8644/m.18976 type:complete len:453 (+) Transcript_8644:1-1359(+)
MRLGQGLKLRKNRFSEPGYPGFPAQISSTATFPETTPYNQEQKTCKSSAILQINRKCHAFPLEKMPRKCNSHTRKLNDAQKVQEYNADQLIARDVENDINRTVKSSAHGYRLGGKGARKNLAALTRARRQKLVPSKVGTFIATDQNERQRCIEEKVKDQDGLSIMFHVFPVEGTFVPNVDINVFSNGISRRDTRDAGKRKGEWTCPSLNSKYRVVCVTFYSLEDGMQCWERYSTKNMNKYRKIYHLGEPVFLRAVSKQSFVQDEIPFGSFAEKHNIQLGEGEKHTYNLWSTLQDLDLPALLDIIGDRIPDVYRVFERHCVRSRKGADVIPDTESLTKSLTEMFPYDIERARVSMENLKKSDQFEILDFCRSCVYYFSEKKGGKPALDITKAKEVFDQFKLFPEDDFVHIAELGDMIRCLGRDVDHYSIEESFDLETTKLFWKDFKGYLYSIN